MLNSPTWCRKGNTGRFVLITVYLLLTLLMQTVALYAQQKGRPHYQLLWRINGPGLQAPSYLFGTMHLTDKRVFEFSDSVLTALRNASSFAMEVDMDSLMAYMLSPDGPLLDTVNHLRHVLSPDEYRYVDSLVIEKTGAPLEELRLKRLWFVEKLLIDEDEVLDKSTGPARKTENIFLDGWLHQKVTGLHKPVHSLERIRNQMDIMDANISDVQKEAFLWNLGYNNTGQTQNITDRIRERATSLESLVDLYYEGNLEEIAKVVNDWGNSGEDLDLELRNNEMARNLAALINKGSVFAAVGVAHLPGEKGILSLLREKGYSVTPVKATFTGITQRERQRLDSLKGYSLNRIVDGYSVELPGIPMAYPIPNLNRKMYIGGGETEAGFAFTMDIPQLATDKRELVNTMINNMAAQGNAVLQRSYPITYRNIAGTEAVLLQQSSPLYIRVFIRNNRAFVFMHSYQGKDSSARKTFFQSVRFYDIVRPVTVYDTLRNVQQGFAVIMPSEANHIQTGNSGNSRPQEVYSALDDANNISYVLQIQKMQVGYYNINDKQVLESIREQLLRQDSAMKPADSALDTQGGLPRYRYSYRYTNSFISRLHFIPRGNLMYCLVCTYDSVRTDSSYWQRFLYGFQLLPLQAHPPTVTFTPANSSFTIAGPGIFTGNSRDYSYGSSPVNVQYYAVMDSGSSSMYMIEIDKYSPYYHDEPDSLLKKFVLEVDTTFILNSKKQYVSDGLPVYEVEMKVRSSGLRFYRKAVIAGHTVYRMSAILPEELVTTGYGPQFLASFRPGRKEKADTRRLQQKKLDLLLKDLRSTDTTAFNAASKYLPNFTPDSSDIGPVLNALAKPFPADTGDNNTRIKLLLSLGKIGGDAVVHTTEMLFTATTDLQLRKRMLRFLNGLSSDSAIRTFLRLAPELPEGCADRGIFTGSFKTDSLYHLYLPDMIAAAERSGSFLHAFTAYTSHDSLWLPPQFNQHKLERLLPGVTEMFKRQLRKWKDRDPDADSSWNWENDLLQTGHILALPGMPSSSAEQFRELLADTTMSLRALGARGLMRQGVKVSDKILNSILTDHSTAYTFIQTVKEQQQLQHIRHLLSQDLLGRSYLTYYLEEEYTLSAIEMVTHIRVQPEKTPAVSLILYRYKTEDSEDWEYVLNGPHPLEPAKLNFEPELMHWINDKSIVMDRKQLTAVATKAYKDYLEEKD